MTVDLNSWRKMIEQVVAGIADQALQRRAWFGIDPEQSSPDEEFYQFFDDVAVEAHLARNDPGKTGQQRQAERHLAKLMRELSKQTPEHIDPVDLINDPRWRKVRAAASRFHALLQTGNVSA